MIFIHKGISIIVYFITWLAALFNERKICDPSGAERDGSTGLIPWLQTTLGHKEQRYQQPRYQPIISNVSAREDDYRRISNIRRNKSQNWTISRLVM